MIKRFINKLLGTSMVVTDHVKKMDPSQHQEHGPKVHKIDASLVDDHAIDVVHTLKQAGYQAYIVGGAVRDLLVGLRPKDFDVATNAEPEQVKRLFRRAFIIGRRFRIVHVIYGRGREHEVIEVSTFRAQVDSSLSEPVGGNERTSRTELAGLTHAVHSSGRVLRDNVWGTMQEDAARRDFTVNAMYYDPEANIVVDYHQGMHDIKKRVLRMIGDPATRYREDPVRIIRAVRFSAKLALLGFKLETSTAKPLREMTNLLNDVPQSRLFDEMLKLLQTGHAQASIEQLKVLGLGTGIYPLLDVVVHMAHEPFLQLALQDTDRRVHEDKPVVASFLLSCVLWRAVREGWQSRCQSGMHIMPALQDAIDEAFNAKIGEVSGRGKLGADMREIWTLQLRFEKRTGRSPYTLVEQPRFRAAFDFLRLREQSSEIDAGLSDWWESFSTASDDERREMLEQIQRERERQPRRVVKRASASSPQPDTGLPTDLPTEESTPPARKRRRRRKPAGGEPGNDPA